MPVYEYLCRTCESHFEARRTMAEASSPIACPDGHAETTRLLSMFASIGRTAAADANACAAPVVPAGGCGGHCACAG